MSCGITDPLCAPVEGDLVPLLGLIGPTTRANKPYVHSFMFQKNVVQPFQHRANSGEIREVSCPLCGAIQKVIRLQRSLHQPSVLYHCTKLLYEAIDCGHCSHATSLFLRINDDASTTAQHSTAPKSLLHSKTTWSLAS